MRNSIILLVLLFMCTGNYTIAQIVDPVNPAFIPHASAPHKTSQGSLMKQLEGSLSSSSIYMAGFSNTLNFTFQLTNVDEEYGDSISIIFPTGFTINSVSNDNVFANFNSDTDEEFNGIDGQTVSWGDNDNVIGGIYTNQTITFSINVAVDESVSGPQTIQYFVSGDGFGGDPGDLFGSLEIEQNSNISQVQFIHNSADLNADELDIRIDGVLLESLDDLPFRHSTAFIPVPSSESILVTLHHADSENADDPLFSINSDFETGELYIAIIEGITSASGYNPTFAERPFEISIYNPAREISEQAGNVDILVSHGATDAESIDINELNNGIPLLVDDISYGELQGYFEILSNDLILQITNDDGSEEIERYVAPLASLDLTNMAVTILSSGFVDPSINSNGADFGLFMATPAGGELIPLLLNASNDLPCDAIPIPGDGSVVFGTNVGSTAALNEVSPPGGSGTDNLSWFVEEANAQTSVWYKFGAPASGSVSISLCNSITNFDTQLALYSADDCNDFSSFQLLAANDDSSLDNCNAQTEFASSLTACGLTQGEVYFIQVDGYNGDLGEFGISIDITDGSDCYARVQFVHNSADLSLETADIRINGGFTDPSLNDLQFRNASPYFDVPAGMNVPFSINPEDSNDESEAILETSLSLQTGVSYQVVLQGIASLTGYNPDLNSRPLELIVVNNAQEASDIETEVTLGFIHGSTDAPSFYVNEIPSGTDLLNGVLAYGESFEYLPADPAVFNFELETAPNVQLGIWQANFNEAIYTGKVISIFASGFLNPDQNSAGPEFGLWASLPEGGALIPLNSTTSINDLPAVLNRVDIFPNPSSERLTIQYELKNNIKMDVELLDMLGKTILTEDLGYQNTGLHQQNIDVSDLSAGFYLLKLQAGNEFFISKFQVVQ